MYSEYDYPQQNPYFETLWVKVQYLFPVSMHSDLQENWFVCFVNAPFSIKISETINCSNTLNKINAKI